MVAQEQKNKLWQYISYLAKQEGAININAIPTTKINLNDWISPWLQKNYHGEMSYMENHSLLRQKPFLLFPNTQSFILLAFPYYHLSPYGNNQLMQISSYAWGDDYHKRIKQKLKRVLMKVQSEYPWFQARAFVDSAPVPEKILGALSGLGWIGKNTLLINPQYGSYVFLAEIACNVLFNYCSIQKNRCGSCQRCLLACPTGALKADSVLDATKCISYLTIEKHTDFTQQEAESLDKHLFGCDICQQVCPWNRFAKEGSSEYAPRNEWLNLTLENWKNLTQEQFLANSLVSPMRRTGHQRIQRNIQAILANT